MKTLVGGLSGAGYFGGVELDAWTRVKGGRIAALADPDLAKAKILARRFGVPRIYRSLGSMIKTEKLDFLDIATRPSLHPAQVREAARHGLSVICQKPPAPSLSQARRMIRDCEKAGVRLMIHENFRWQPWHRKIRQVLDAGLLGRVFYARFVIRRGDGRGPRPFAAQPYFKKMKAFLMFECLIHFLDTSRFLFGDIESLHSVHRRINPVLAGEDFCLSTVEMKAGFPVLIDANRFSDPPTGPRRAFASLSVEGTKGSLTLSLDGRLWFRPLGRGPRRIRFSIPGKGYFGDSCRLVQQHFIDRLKSGRPFETEGRDYLKTFEAVFAAYDSARTGRSRRLART